MRHISHFSLACALIISSGLAHAIEQTPTIDAVTGTTIESTVLDTTITQTSILMKNASNMSKQFLSHLRFSATERSISFNSESISKWSFVKEKFGAIPGNPNSGTSAWMLKYRIYGDDDNTAKPSLRNAFNGRISEMALH